MKTVFKIISKQTGPPKTNIEVIFAECHLRIKILQIHFLFKTDIMIHFRVNILNLPFADLLAVFPSSMFISVDTPANLKKKKRKCLTCKFFLQL